MKVARILLVEDDIDFGESFAIILRRKGYFVCLAPLAQQALTILS